MLLDDVTVFMLFILFVVFSFAGAVTNSKTRSERLLIMAVIYMFALCAMIIYR